MAKTKFEVYKDKTGNFRWRLLAQNGEPVATSGEGFSEKRTAMNGVKKLKEWANTEEVLDLEKIKEDAEKAKIKAKAEAEKMKLKAAAEKAKAAAKKIVTKAVVKPAVKKVVKKVSKPATKKETLETEEVSAPSVL
jgi:uncharacterized protein YegP (UPF0339 family)